MLYIQNSLNLNYRTYDEAYSFILYSLYKLNNIFDIYVNGEKIKVVSEEYSLLFNESGNLHCIVIDVNKKRKRRLLNITCGYWKQNGEESFLKVKTPMGISIKKRNFTQTDDENSDKSYKSWEYSLFRNKEPKGIILRHYLKDLQSSHVRYVTKDIQVSLVSKTPCFSNNIFNVAIGDYSLINTIFKFSKNIKIIEKSKTFEIDTDIKLLNLNQFIEKIQENLNSNNNNNINI